MNREKKSVGLGCIGIILPNSMGIFISQYKDPY